MPPLEVHAFPDLSTNPEDADVERHIMILYSSPVAGLDLLPLLALSMVG